MSPSKAFEGNAGLSRACVHLGGCFAKLRRAAMFKIIMAPCHKNVTRNTIARRVYCHRESCSANLWSAPCRNSECDCCALLRPTSGISMNSCVWTFSGRLDGRSEFCAVAPVLGITMPRCQKQQGRFWTPSPASTPSENLLPPSRLFPTPHCRLQIPPRQVQG